MSRQPHADIERRRPGLCARRGARQLAGALFGLALASAASGQALTECRVPGLRNSVQCGVLQRPLDPARPSGMKIGLHYVVVPAMARRKLPDPVFLIAGGPGQSAIDVAPQVMPLFSRLNNRRDIVFVDQRGTGTSAPLLCADPRDESLSEQTSDAGQYRLAMACKAALVKLPYIGTPANLGFFTTPIAMQDLDAVRQQLAAPRIDLVGVSYGTRAALDYMRQFPDRVRRAVLDSVAPPDMDLPASSSVDSQAALDALFHDCELDPTCAGHYPRLRADWQALLASLPRPASAAQPLTGRPEHYALTRDMVLNAVRGALYSPAVAAALPAAISAAASGHDEGLVGLASILQSGQGPRLAMGMHFSVICAEDAPLLDKSTPPAATDFGDSYARLYQRVCADWPRGAVPAAFYTVPPTRTPTLLLAGGLDPATPPRHAARVARSLGPQAHLVVVPQAGHSVFGTGCAGDLIFRFIDAADPPRPGPVDAGCLTSIPRPGVFRPIEPAPVDHKP